MKNILTKIYIHPFTYIVFLISLITGLYKELCTFLFIIVIHELGHIVGSMIFKWNIDRINILPFGAVTIFNEKLNRPMIEEFIILIMGPLFQFINFMIFKDSSNYFNYYNYGLFIFNMLPIYPLDGYKLFSIILNKYIPYKKVLKIMLVISILCLTLFIRKDLIYIVILLLLFKGILIEFKMIDLTYNKFLLERYLYNFKFKKRKNINDINNMYRDCYHIFGNKTEKEVVYERFKKYSIMK